MLVALAIAVTLAAVGFGLLLIPDTLLAGRVLPTGSGAGRECPGCPSRSRTGRNPPAMRPGLPVRQFACC